MSSFSRIAQTIAISIAFLFVLSLVLFISSTSTYFAELEPIHVFVALVPFIVLLMVSGRLKEIAGPGGISLSMHDAVQKPILPQAGGMKLEIDPEITMEKGAIPAIQERIAENPPTTLSLQVHRQGYYSEFAIRHYIEELERYPDFRNVLFIDADGKFRGLIRAEDFRNVLSEHDVVPLLENGRILEHPAVIAASVPIGVTNQQALSEMDRLDKNALAVVNHRGEFVGVVTQEEIVRKVLTKVLREV